MAINRGDFLNSVKQRITSPFDRGFDYYKTKIKPTMPVFTPNSRSKSNMPIIKPRNTIKNPLSGKEMQIRRYKSKNGMTLL